MSMWSKDSWWQYQSTSKKCGLLHPLTLILNLMDEQKPRLPKKKINQMKCQSRDLSRQFASERQCLFQGKFQLYSKSSKKYSEVIHWLTHNVIHLLVNNALGKGEEKMAIFPHHLVTILRAQYTWALVTSRVNVLLWTWLSFQLWAKFNMLIREIKGSKALRC